jgi:GH24 family phage-related lysozyme (muramidase)
MSMKTSTAGRAAISAREGCILTAYKDSAGVLTIGVGHTPRLVRLRRVSMT